MIDTLEINAPVNWSKAVSPFVEMLRRHSPGGVSIPHSLCIWDSGYSVTRQEGSQIYRSNTTDVVAVDASTGGCKGISGFAVAPISYPIVSREVNLGAQGYVDKFLSALFDKRLDFLTFKWYSETPYSTQCRRTAFFS